MANQRFQKVFVFKDPSTEFVTTNTNKPHQLTSGQGGFFQVDNDEIIGNGTGLAPAPTSFPSLQFHQNIGDSKFGTVRTKTIKVGAVKKYYKVNTTSPLTEIWYVGYDGVTGTSDIQVPCGYDLILDFVLYGKKLTQWYGQVPGYRKSLVINTGCCAVGAPDAIVDQDFIADLIVASFNVSNARKNDYPVGNELKTFITATKVTTGTQGAASYRVGVKFESVAIPEDTFNTCDPTRWLERELVSFTVNFRMDCQVTVPVVQTQAATPGSGWAAQVADMEKESQGYDRVREVYENNRFMVNQFIYRATAGVKHDMLFLDYDWTHETNPMSYPSHITEPYTAVFISPTSATLQPVATYLNAWLTGRFPAITI